MQSARQRLPAGEAAHVGRVDAAFVAALVLAAGPLLDALLLANGVVGPASHVGASQLLVHGTASTKHLMRETKIPIGLAS